MGSEANVQLLSIDNVAHVDVRMDHIYFENKHLIAFGDVTGHQIYVREITKTINDYINNKDKLNKDGETKDEIDNNNDDDEKSTEKDKQQDNKVIFHPQDLGSFKADVNAVSFSPDGEFLGNLVNI